MISLAKKTTPQAVSAVLRRAGWLPVPRDREGLHVSRSRGGASVLCDWTDEAKGRTEALAITWVLEAEGYTVEPNPHDYAILYVSKPGSVQ